MWQHHSPPLHNSSLFTISLHKAKYLTWRAKAGPSGKPEEEEGSPEQIYGTLSNNYMRRPQNDSSNGAWGWVPRRLSHRGAEQHGGTGRGWEHPPALHVRSAREGHRKGETEGVQPGRESWEEALKTVLAPALVGSLTNQCAGPLNAGAPLWLSWVPSLTAKKAFPWCVYSRPSINADCME